jgi:hypothetical protein
MRQALDRFSEMSTVYGFSCRIYVLSPLAELASGAHQKTYRTIAAMVSGNCSMGEINTPLLREGEPEQYFYPLDGHYNARGAAEVADFLAHETRRTP